MISIYGIRRSRATRALWALEEAGLDYEFRPVDMRSGEHRRPDYLALNPSGKVPTLVDGDLVLRESGAIVNWIGRRAPDTGLMPRTEHEQALYDQWSYFVLSELEQPLWLAAKHTFALPSRYRVPAVKPTAYKEFSWAARVLAQGLGAHAFLLGDRFTMVDVLAGHTLAWATQALKLELESPVLVDYATRVLDRPALARAYAAEDR